MPWGYSAKYPDEMGNTRKAARKGNIAMKSAIKRGFGGNGDLYLAFIVVHCNKELCDWLKEMLRNEKLQKLPETREARERLAEWGVSVG